MKKAKMMLSAIAVFAVIGGAFAFKAKTFTRHELFTGAAGSGVCTIEESGVITTASGSGTQLAASTVSLSSGCTNTAVTTISDAE